MVFETVINDHFSQMEPFYRKAISKKILKLTGKHLWWPFFKTCLPVVMDIWCFLVNFTHFFQNSVFTKHFRATASFFSVFIDHFKGQKKKKIFNFIIKSALLYLLYDILHYSLLWTDLSFSVFRNSFLTSGPRHPYPLKSFMTVVPII